MLRKTNNIVPLQIKKVQVAAAAAAAADEFYKPLYKNCNLLRIVLRRSIENKIQLNKWYRMDLKLVTEMGLLMDQHPYPIQLKCKLLINNKFALASFIQTRPITEDAWDPEAARSEGFHPHKPIGGLEYRIITSVPIQRQQPFYISLIKKDSSSHSTTNILPLTVGPLFIIDEDGALKEDGNYPHLNALEGQQHRALESCLSKDTYFLLKEQWNDGTPGKIWDSAIVMTKILIKLFASDPNHLSNKRILDLSAGTGYIGLSIAQYYQRQKPDLASPPHIILTDLPEALELIARNQDLNDIQPSRHLAIVPLRWGNRVDAEKIRREGRVDMIIASDVLYNVVHFSSLISTFRDLCDNSTMIYLCYKQRGLSVQEENVFFNQCKKYFRISQLDSMEKMELKHYEATTAVRIYKLQLYSHTSPRWEHLLFKLAGK